MWFIYVYFKKLRTAGDILWLKDDFKCIVFQSVPGFLDEI